MNQDESHLRLLAIFHYVLAAGSAVFSSVFLFHFVWGLSILQGKRIFDSASNAATQPPPAVAIMMMLMGGGAIALGWAFAACLVVAGRSLAAKKRHMFCMVIAGFACVLCNPLGTVLGVFTIMTLQRPSVKELFGVA